jgi:hypothetical protein
MIPAIQIGICMNILIGALIIFRRRSACALSRQHAAGGRLRQADRAGHCDHHRRLVISSAIW